MSCMWIKDDFHFQFNSAQVSGLPTELPTISKLESSGLPTELPTVSISVISGQSNLHGKIPMGSPWAAHSTAHWATHFFIFGSSGLPTELPTVSLEGSSGQPNLHSKIPMGIPWAAHSAAHWAAHYFNILEAVGCLLSGPLSCPLLPYTELVGSLICMAKFP